MVKDRFPDLGLPAPKSDKELEDAAKKALLAKMQNSGNVFCYMDFKVGESGPDQ